MGEDLPTWREAWTQASSFYARERPGDHFATAASENLQAAGPSPTAQALASLVLHVAATTASPIDIVDVGGADGSLLRDVLDDIAQRDPKTRRRCVGTVVDLRAEDTADVRRPTGDAPAIRRIVGDAPDAVPHGIVGVLIAHELLDDVPLDIVLRTTTGDRLITVDPRTGEESVSDAVPGEDDARWIDRWRGTDDAGRRIECGRTRDELWAALSDRMDHGLLVAVDYATTAGATAPGTDGGTLRAFRDGAPVAPVPDGTCNLTAAVALDACAQAAASALAVRGLDGDVLLLPQADAIAAWCPEPQEPMADASAQDRLRRLAAAAARSGYANPSAIGALTWLVQCVGPVPAPSTA